MKLTIVVSVSILLSIASNSGGTSFYVPSRNYPRIQDAINAASDGDEVVVAPGIYTGPGNRNLDFGAGLPAGQTRAIILRSTINPDFPDWDIVAATVIDCGGKPEHREAADSGAANRAFWFHRGEGPNTVVMGFTIRNGYSRGHKGADGAANLPDQYTWLPPMHNGPYWPFDTAWHDPCGPPIADYGQDSPFNARGYGGAILCGADGRNLPADRVACSPTIRYCIIEDCTVTGGEGGRGADGMDGPFQWYAATAYVEPGTPGCAPIDLTDSPVLICDPEAEPGDEPQERDPLTSENGQWGGRGGDGDGMGFGGAIACRNASSPVITGCIFRNNIARGGVGGDGGNGGDPFTEDFGETWDGDEASGGDAGWGWGDGTGGVIYSEGGGGPIVTNCTFEGSTATMGLGGEGGARSQGNEGDPRALEGLNGIAVPDGLISGGAAYYNNLTTAEFTNCTFIGNAAYEISVPDQLSGVPSPARIYTVGGALYFYGNNNVNLSNCDFTNNSGGAVYCGQSCNISISNDYDPNGECSFSGNSDPNDSDDLWTDRHVDFGTGAAVYIGKDCTVNLRGCNFGGNSAKNEGGALMSKSDASLTGCSFSNNTAGNYGGAIDLYDMGRVLTIEANDCSFVGNEGKYGGAISSEVFAATFTNCYLSNNTAEVGGALHLVSGVVEITGGGISGNVATGGGGGGMHCQLTEAQISNCTIQDNSAYGVSGSGGGVNFAGAAAVHVVKNCLLTGNYAATNGGAIFCSNATPEIENCTFFGNATAGNGGAIFADWSSLALVTNCILSNCTSHAIHEEDFTGDAVVTHSLFYNNSDGDYYDAGTGTTYTGPDGIADIPSGRDNIYGDSLFVTGPGAIII